VNFRMNICYKFLPDCSDLLNYEDETSTKW
jgi:hypothetical protein